MYIITPDADQRLPIKVWLEDGQIDIKTLIQAKALANHPIIRKHVALMPDCHVGMGMPIGGVIACEEAVIPNAVGVDIGCGMMAVKTNFRDKISTKKLKKIISNIKEFIPMGFEHHVNEQPWSGFNEAPLYINVVKSNLQSARKQIGTLGGGNHFIEFQRDESGTLWLMVHSGSRNFGFKIAKYFNERAEFWNKIFYSKSLDYGKELCFLPIGKKETSEYLDAMQYALMFAENNRMMMAERALGVLENYIQFDIVDSYKIHHNFVAIENHFGKNYFVHRKGATRAFKDQIGIIPGSMGTSSYIVKGLGNIESFMSCSHGAGRTMGRNEFCKKHRQKDCDKAMKGVVFGGWGLDRKGNVDISEAPQAYKDIDVVMENQKDLVEIVHKLKPIAVLKG